MKEKAAYLRGLIEGLGIDETTKEGKVIKAMSELLSEMAEAVDSIDEDVTHAYDQINDLSEELEDLEADLYEDEDDEEFEDDYEPSPRPVERRERERSVRSEPSYTSPAMDELEARRSNKVVNIRAATQLQVVLVKPERFENASEIADHLREKRTVVLNLESTNKEIARRLLDFLSGVAYANEGKIKKVAISTYIITPYNVDILGDLIDELENNGLYF